MTYVSHAQNFEDVILLRCFQNLNSGFYIDIGAQDPSVDSISLSFYKKGWRGVHIEPNPEFVDKLRSSRPDETILPIAVGSQSEYVDFYTVAGSGLSTANKDVAEKYKIQGKNVNKIRVPTRRLDDILNDYKSKVIHWLKIDVEGMEQSVVESWEHSSVRPWILVIESTLPNSPELVYSNWEANIVNKGYECVYFDGLNRFYLHESHLYLKSKFALPPNIFDGFFLTERSQFVEKVFHEKLDLKRQLDSARDQILSISNQLHDSNATIENMVMSWSWRLTRPFRNLWLFFKRLGGAF